MNENHRQSFSRYGWLRWLAGTPTTNSGYSIDVSSNGTTSLPADAVQAILEKRFQEMHQQLAASAATPAEPSTELSTPILNR